MRTGLAICDKEERLAVPLEVLIERKEDALLEKILCKAKETKAEMIVMGLPINMDGTEGESALHVREVAELLKVQGALQVDLMDERGTTMTAHEYLNTTNVRGKKRKAKIDAVAATIILQDYLDFRRNKYQSRFTGGLESDIIE